MTSNRTVQTMSLVTTDPLDLWWLVLENSLVNDLAETGAGRYSSLQVLCEEVQGEHTQVELVTYALDRNAGATCLNGTAQWSCRGSAGSEVRVPAGAGQGSRHEETRSRGPGDWQALCGSHGAL
jgi:hypothetical protein